MRTGALLLHGLTGMPSELRPVERFLSRNGIETEAPLLAGHGGSHHELIDSKWTEWVESARTALRSLLTRVDRVVIIGLSMGGTIGAILAEEECERVSGLVMLSPTLSYDGSNLDNLVYQRIYKSRLLRDTMHVAVAMMPVLGRVLYWTETPPYGLKDPRLQAKITRSIEEARAGGNTRFGLFRTYFASLFEMNLLTDRFRRIAGSVKCPVQILHSFEDTLASLSNATETYSLIGSQDRRLIGLTGCDHVMTLDLQREHVCSLVGDFINSISDRAVSFQAAPSRSEPGPVVELCEQLSEEASTGRLIDQYLFDHQAVFPEMPVLSAGTHVVVRVDDEIDSVLPLFLTEKREIVVGCPPDYWRASLDRCVGEHRISDLIADLLGNLRYAWQARRVTLAPESSSRLVTRATRRAEAKVVELC